MNPGKPAARIPDYFTCLDGVRGLAALVIVIFHYHHFYLADAGDRGALPEAGSFPYAMIFEPLYLYGSYAVELFWVISGFVFAHVYLARPTSLRNYAAARFARLYPLHLASLLIIAALQIVSLQAAGHWQIYENNDLRHFLLQLGMSSHWITLSRGLSFNGPIWSVSLELVAYALFFFALPLLRRYGLTVALGLGALFWTLALHPAADLPGIRAAAFLCTGYFFCGVAAYMLLRLWPGKLPWMVMAAAGLAAAGAMSGMQRLFLANASLAIILLVAQLDMGLAGQRLPRWLGALGDMSYSIYLVHVPLQIALLLFADLALGGSRAFAHSLWLMPAYLALVLGLAYLSYTRFEKPVGRWLRRHLSHPARPARA